MGFAQDGTAITDGANLAIQGVPPSGLAAQGQVIWRLWQLLASAVARGSPTVSTFTTPAIDTTGATLLIVLNGVSATMTDSAANTWTQIQMGKTFFFGFCVNPTTSTGHTFTASNSMYGALIVLAFKGPQVTFDQYSYQDGFLLSDTTAQSAPITPSASPALVLTVWKGNGTASAVDSNFVIAQNLAYILNSSVALAAAYKIQDTSPSAPTWNVSMSYDGAEISMLSFVTAT